jgi:Serine/threonine protein kinase
MVSTVMHEIPFSFDQPDSVLGALLSLVQQKLRQPPVSKMSRDVVVRNALTILIIDTYQQRAQYLGNLLLAVGYRPAYVANALDAFTLFLQGGCLPLAIVLGDEDSSHKLFLNRLQQQLMQRYDWDLLMVHLVVRPQPTVRPPANMSRPLYMDQPSADVSSPFGHTGGRNDTRPRSFPPERPLSSQLPWPGVQPPVPNFGSNTTHAGLPPIASAPGSSTYTAPEEVPFPSPPSVSSPSQQSFSDALPVIPPYQEVASRPVFPSQPAAPLYPNPNPNPNINTHSSSTLHPLQSGPVAPATPLSPPSRPLPVMPQTPPVAPSVSSHELQRSVTLPGKQERVYIDGQSLGRYQVNARLGSSEYSVVYQVYDRLREMEYALKAIQVDVVPYYMMRESLEEVTVFEQEADLLGQLKHPHILPVLKNGKTYTSGANFIYKTMPLCSDGQLQNWLRRNGKGHPFTFKELVPIILQLAEALQFVHNFQITFQNFKMSNILVLNPTKKIQKLEVALADFSVVQDGSFLPTSPDSLPYIAPERWDGVVHPASDQYGLAAVAYELFTGRPPFQANSEHIMKILHTTRLPQPPSSLNPKLPIGVNSVLLRALAKNPAERFASMQYFIQALGQC